MASSCAEAQKAATDFVNPRASGCIITAAAGGDRGALMSTIKSPQGDVAKLQLVKTSLVADAITHAQQYHVRHALSQGRYSEEAETSSPLPGGYKS
jgi:hypothetical protein